MADVKRLVESSMVPPLAKEVASQINAAFANVRRLVELGMVPPLAKEVATQINTAVANTRRLVELSMVPELAKEVAAQIDAVIVPVNLLQHSDAFDLWSPNQATVSEDVANDPVRGELTVDRVTETAITSSHVLNAVDISFTLGQAYTFSVYAKYETAQFIQLLFGSAAFGSNGWGNFDIQNGTLGTMGTATTGSIENVGGGWFRVIATVTATATAAAPVALVGADSGTMTRGATYAGSTANTRLVADAQVETGPTANAYVPTA